MTEHLTIPMSDGVRLAAKLWLPMDAEADPVPAILELIPYRKRDWTAQRDAATHPYFAERGYACLRVDLRGSGESEGVLRDEYVERELLDAVEIMRWFAAQPWCSGKVGMMGISWGGFNALQVAALRPPELGAIITVCSTDDRYADDIHYMGGCLLGDNLSWASTMLARNADPPDPALVGDAWHPMWMQRLEEMEPWLAVWLRHQHRGAYWRHGSICEDYAAIRCPVFAISGWADGYSNAVFRMLDRLEVPRLGLVGPWSHKYPHLGVPGPAIGFLHEAVRWWDHWLKGIDTGIMEEPQLRAWMQDSAPPSTGYMLRPGRWVGERVWPSSEVADAVYHLTPNCLAREAPSVEEELWVQSPLSVGLFAGKWCSYSAPPDLPDDQREEDGGCLVFETPPLEETMDILGAPVAELVIAASEPVAMVAVRLGDVRPDGAITRVTFGLLNLTHRLSNENPTALEPGRRYECTVQLNDVAQTFPKGHRIRLSISSSYWPLAWPSPRPSRLTLTTGASRLRLPVRSPRRDEPRIVFASPEVVRPLPVTAIAAPEAHWRTMRDLGRNESVLEVVNDRGRMRFEDIDWEVASRCIERYGVQHHDWRSMYGETQWYRSFHRGDFSVRTRTVTRLRCDEERFFLDAELDAYEGERRVHCRSWCTAIPRELV